jgi:hypothetical protein
LSVSSLGVRAGPRACQRHDHRRGQAGAADRNSAALRERKNPRALESERHHHRDLEAHLEAVRSRNAEVRSGHRVAARLVQAELGLLQ